ADELCLAGSADRKRLFAGGYLRTLVYAGYGEEEPHGISGRGTGAGAIGRDLAAAGPCVGTAGICRGPDSLQRKSSGGDGAASRELATGRGLAAGAGRCGWETDCLRGT